MEENQFLKEKEEKEKKKKAENDLKIQVEIKETKLRRQKIKNDKKKIKKTSVDKTNKSTPRVPNIRNVPKNCLNLVNEGDLLYVVPGDGACAPNAAAASLFQDEIFGPKLRRMMNLFMAKHWYRNYQYISQCSLQNPFVRKLKGIDISFTDPKKLIASSTPPTK